MGQQTKERGAQGMKVGVAFSASLPLIHVVLWRALDDIPDIKASCFDERSRSGFDFTFSLRIFLYFSDSCRLNNRAGV